MNARADNPYDACLKDALSLARDWIPRWLGLLQEALHQREGSAAHLHEKQGYTQARMVLAGCRDRLAERFLLNLGDGVSAAIAAEASRSAATHGTAHALDALSLDDLELMDHQQVQASVELARLQQVVKMAADEELMGLCALFSGAMGLPTVRHEANPFRPEIVVEALLKAITQLKVDEPTRTRWLHVGAVALGGEMQRFYRGLSQRLRQEGVQPAGYVVVPSATGRPAAAPGGARGESVPPQSMVGSNDVLTLDHLHQLLVGNLESGGAAVSDQGASGSGNAMVRTLAAEVVTLMLRSIADDGRLLGPVRDMVQQLKPALMHLARSEPRFFADRQNPARRLLETITARSLAFTSEQDTGYAEYAQRVLQAVQALQSTTQGLPERIEAQLRQLEQRDLVAQPRGQGLAMQTLVRVEQRHLLAERVATEIQARNDFARAPGLIRRFLSGPWAQVVAHARLNVDGNDLTDAEAQAAQRYMDVLPDLLWSSQLSQASLNRPRLVRVIPNLLRTLREGLDAIDYPRAQTESFFQALMGLHEAAYKTQRNEDGPAFQPSRPPEIAPEPWLHGSEARDSGYMDADGLMPEFEETQPLSRPASLEPERLEVGAWVEWEQDGKAQRCQLRWASPHGTMFLFAAADGHSISLTRRGLDRLIAAGRLRVVANQGVVDEALAAVARQAWINSGKL